MGSSRPAHGRLSMFEWAWQHPDLSLNLKGEDGGAVLGRSRTFSGNIRTVRFMINAHPYSTWPLHVKIFSEEAVRAWNNAAKAYPCLPQGFTSTVELEGVDGIKASIHIGSGRNGPIDIDDANFTAQHLATAAAVRSLRNGVTCKVCDAAIDFHKVDPLTVALCPTASCHAISHIPCLATSFLSQAQEQSEAIIPRGGNCLSCHRWVLWGDIIRGADRRKYGADIMEKGGITEDSEETDAMDFDSELAASPVQQPMPATRTGKKPFEKATADAKLAATPRKQRVPTSIIETLRRGPPPKNSQRAGAPYSTSALAGADEEFEDFSVLIDGVDNMTEDEDSSDHVVRVLAGTTLTSPTRARFA